MLTTSSSKNPLTDQESAEIEAGRALARARFAHFASDEGAASGIVDPDNPPMTDEDFARLRPAVEVVPALVAARLRRKGGRPRSSEPEVAAPVQSAVERDAEEFIKLYEERLEVGKREVSHGRLRVRSYVVETPVDEQVSLRTESVQVDRRPVDRQVSATDALFQDRTIELEEFAEEAVVSKQARVVEEISLRKEASERVESIHDTVRHTEVEIDDGCGVGTAKTGMAADFGARLVKDMEVVGSDGVHVGTIDRVEGTSIKLKMMGAASDGRHHLIPISMWRR